MRIKFSITMIKNGKVKEGIATINKASLPHLLATITDAGWEIQMCKIVEYL